MVSLQTGSVLDRTVLKEGQLFLVADRAGDVTALNSEGHGLYYHDTRFLSLFELDLSGTRLALLSSAGELNFMNNLQFTNDTVLGHGGEVVAAPRTISMRRNRFLLEGLHERIGFVNYNPHPVRLTTRITFGADFRDMFEVRGYALPETDERGNVLPPRIARDGLTFEYDGRDGTVRRTHITFSPAPTSVEIVNERMRTLRVGEVIPGLSGFGDPRVDRPTMPPAAAAVFEVDLAPGTTQTITINIRPELGKAEPESHDGVSLDDAFHRIRDSYLAWDQRRTRISTDNEVFDQLIQRAVDDLRLLTDTQEGDLVPSAGIPWFSVPFGRDSLITAMQTLMLRPDLAEGTLRFLARHQGTRVDDFRDEEPGKILHEVRLGELARLGAVPHTPYYGSVDSTPLFLMALGEYLDWTANLDLVQELLPNAERALGWIDVHGDLDGDGFLEYQTRSARGIQNQGWKDSHDSAAFRDGTIAHAPIALAEVQGYTYAARRAMAQVYDRLNMAEHARLQMEKAERLRQAFLHAFAMEDPDGPFWAMALDREKRQVNTVTSNPGHVLWVGMLHGDEADLTVRRLLAEDMASGWGIRTLSSTARTFNPMSYHNGSIWPHDNGIVALGMKRVGADAAAAEVASQVFDAGLRLPGYRLPELYCGFARDRRYHSLPAQYPVSCSPQAWAAGSVFMLLQALLGIEADAPNGTLRVRPLLPPWLSHVSLRKLLVGGRRVDLDVFREGHRTRVEVLEHGGLRVQVREPNGGG